MPRVASLDMLRSLVMASHNPGLVGQVSPGMAPSQARGGQPATAAAAAATAAAAAGTGGPGVAGDAAAPAQGRKPAAPKGKGSSKGKSAPGGKAGSKGKSAAAKGKPGTVKKDPAVGGGAKGGKRGAATASAVPAATGASDEEGPEIDPTTMSKVELRRARRMKSNRESARRSRKRKQEHLSGLEEEISALEDKLSQVKAALELAEQRESKLEAFCQQLQRENAALRAGTKPAGGLPAVAADSKPASALALALGVASNGLAPPPPVQEAQALPPSAPVQEAQAPSLAGDTPTAKKRKS